VGGDVVLVCGGRVRAVVGGGRGGGGGNNGDKYRNIIFVI